MVVALYGGFWIGLLGAFASCLTVLLLLPIFVHQPFIADSVDWLGMAVFFTACAMISGVAETMHRARAREKQSEAGRDRFFTLSLDMLCIANADGYFERISPAFTRTLGWSAEEILARPYLDLVHPDDRAATLRAVERQIAGGEEVLHFENRYQHKDGSWRVLDWRSAPHPDGLMYAVARDVTERKQGEIDSARFAAIINSSQDAIISKTLDGIITSWNVSAQRLFGYLEQEMIGKPMTRLFPIGCLDEEAGIVARIRAGEHTEHFETVRVKKDGAAIDVSVTISPIKDTSGEIIGVSTIVRDITMQRRIEEELRISSKNLTDVKLALDQHAIVAITDARGKITYINDKFCEISKYLREELIGQDHRIINSGYHPEAFIRELWETINSGRVWQSGALRYRYRGADGIRHERR